MDGTQAREPEDTELWEGPLSWFRHSTFCEAGAFSICTSHVWLLGTRPVWCHSLIKFW